MYSFIIFFSELFAAMSYPFASKTYKHSFYSEGEMFIYCNFYILVFLSIMLIFNRKNINIFNRKKINKVMILGIFLATISTFAKTILLSSYCGVSQVQLKSYTSLKPFLVLLLCSYFLKQQKLNLHIIISFFIVSIVSFICINFDINNFISGVKFYKYLSVYLTIKVAEDVLLKKVSKERGFDLILFDNLMFVLLGVVIFIFAEINEDFTKEVLLVSKFQFSKLFSSQSAVSLFLLALMSFLAHNFKMLSFKVQHISKLIIFSTLSSLVISYVATYLQKGYLPSQQQTIGLCIICIGTIYYKKYDSHKRK